MKQLKLCLCFLLIFCGLAQADPTWKEALSLGATPKYNTNFKHYDYVNPDAPKGGQLNQISTGTFNSFNPYIVMGSAPNGLSARSGGLLYDTLMSSSTQEQSVNYPLIAQAALYPDDYSWVKFKLNPKAKWHDGQAITADDVIWTFETLKKISPFFSNYYHSVISAKKTAENEVTFTFDAAGNRELPVIMAGLPILPKHWWEGLDKNGQKRDISKPTTEIPLGSGAYQIDHFVFGKYIIWKRVANYWGRDLAVNIGRNNFETVRYSYFLDPNAEWEAFKKGGVSDIRQETRIRRWKQDYHFPAVIRGDVVLRSFPRQGSGVMQGYFLNTRRPQLSDIRVREALNLAFDFKIMNASLFYNDYLRINSYFFGLSFASKNLPQGRELEILNTVRDQVPSGVFTKAFTMPVYQNEQAKRAYLTRAMQLLNSAGWQLKNNRLVNKAGQPFQLEFLLDNAAFEGVTALYIDNLQRLGIDATLRLVDASQYQNRQAEFDFDVIVNAIGQSDNPGNEQLEFWGSAAADRQGSYNVSGIKNPAIDTLINQVIYAKNRQDLMAATAALDRVLLWNYYVIPQWASDHVNIAYWNKFGIPEPQPAASSIDIFSWWIDLKKQQRLK